MKKLLLIFLLLPILVFGQSNVVVNKKGRTLNVGDEEYVILIRERIAPRHYRMFLFKDYKYYDCIHNKGKYIMIDVVCKEQ